MRKLKIGDKVYQADGEQIYESTVRDVIYKTERLMFNDNYLGLTVFLTKEDAENWNKRLNEPMDK